MTARFSGEAQQVKDESASLCENATNPEYDGIVQQFDDGKTRKLLRKADWRVLSILSFLYLLAFIDRCCDRRWGTMSVR
jgi:hypothetical protein